MKVRYKAALCCIEGGGLISGCSCANPIHEYVYRETDHPLPEDEVVEPASPAPSGQGDHPYHSRTMHDFKPSGQGVSVPEGMKAWPGGEGAPEDWDGGPVQWGNNEAQFYPELRTDPSLWHPAERRPHHMATIIAYTPKPAPSCAPVEVERLIRYVTEAAEQAEKSGNTAGVWLFAKQWRAIAAALSPQGPDAKEGEE